MHIEIKRYFQLQELPFEQTPNLRFVCDFEFYRHAWQALVASVEKGEPILKVTGEVGTGKTLLCRQLIQALDAIGVVTLYLHHPQFNTDTLLRLIADELQLDNIATHSEYTLYKVIHAAVLAHYHAARRVVLVIDEAQTLPDASLEALRLLTNLESEQRKLIQIVFFGQPELDERLALKKFRQLRQRIGFHTELHALWPQDIAPYLRHRLLSAGHATGELFLPETSAMIYAASRGIPRVINILADKALLAAYAQEKKVIDKIAMQAAVLDAASVIASCQPSKKNFSNTSKILCVVFLSLMLIAATTWFFYRIMVP